MQDYMDSTSNVIEAALSTDALTGDKPYYTQTRRRVCKLLLLGAGILLSTLDVATDWYNYATWRQSENVFQTGSEGVSSTYDGLFLGICTLGTAVLVATFSVLLLQCLAVSRRHRRSARLEFLEEIVFMTSLTLHDVPMVALLAASVSLRFCPLVDQIRTTPGRVALFSTGVSLVFRMVHSLAFCCSCRAKKEEDGAATRMVVKLLTVILRLIRTLLLAIAAVLFLFTVVVSFTPDPNSLPWFRVILQGMDIGGPAHGPIYLYQRYDLPYTVRRFVDKGTANQVIAPPEDFTTFSEKKSQGDAQVDYDCGHYVRRIYLGDSLELRQAGSKGLSQTYPCAEVNTFFETSLPEDFKHLVQTHSCDVTFSMVYDQDTVTLSYRTDVTLTPRGTINATTSSTPESCVKVTLDGMSMNHSSTVIMAWSSSMLTELKDYECEHSYECRTQLPPLFDPHLKPYFSCLGDVCDTRPRPATRDRSIREAVHRFTYTPYRLVLPRAKAYFPCLYSSTTQRQLNIGQCSGASPPRETSRLPKAPAQVLSCPESPFPNYT